MALGLFPLPFPDPELPEDDPERLGKAARPASPPPMMTRMTITTMAMPRLRCRNGNRSVILVRSPGRLEVAAVVVAPALPPAESAMTG